MTRRPFPPNQGESSVRITSRLMPKRLTSNEVAAELAHHMEIVLPCKLVAEEADLIPDPSHPPTHIPAKASVSHHVSKGRRLETGAEIGVKQAL